MKKIWLLFFIISLPGFAYRHKCPEDVFIGIWTLVATDSRIIYVSESVAMHYIFYKMGSGREIAKKTMPHGASAQTNIYYPVAENRRLGRYKIDDW